MKFSHIKSNFYEILFMWNFYACGKFGFVTIFMLKIKIKKFDFHQS